MCGIGTIPEPAAVLAERKRAFRMPLPRSKSPKKTYLQSPARRHPSLVPGSSPLRGSIVTPSSVKHPHSVKRILNFSVDDHGNRSTKAAERGSPQKQLVTRKPGMALTSQAIEAGKPIVQDPKLSLLDNGGDHEPTESEPLDNEGDPYQIPNGDDEHGVKSQGYQNSGDEEEQATNSTMEAVPDSPLKPAKTRGRQPLKRVTAVKKGEKRPLRKRNESPTNAENNAGEVQEAEDDVDERPTKKPRNQTKKPATTMSSFQKAQKPATKNQNQTVSKSNSSPVNISSPAVIQRGPPRPKNSRGLYILRRETPDDNSHTRSGRRVIRPLAYWKNESIIYNEDQGVDGNASFLLPTIKEVIRAEEVMESPRKGVKKGTSKSKKRRQVIDKEDDDNQDPVEPWESEPGRIFGEVRMWDPEDPAGEMSEEVEEEIALSSAAIITRDIQGATFKFAKTLTLPFFGSGMVDLPPGAIKKTKNSRRMQMVFFVFYGRVSVTVNGNGFRIGKGGMWQVPRGKIPLLQRKVRFLTTA